MKHRFTGSERLGVKLPLQTIIKMQEVKLGPKNPMYGRKLSQLIKNNISNSKKGKTPQRSYRRYSIGQKRCTSCDIWVHNAWDILRCPHCNQMLRSKSTISRKEYVRY